MKITVVGVVLMAAAAIAVVLLLWALNNHSGQNPGPEQAQP